MSYDKLITLDTLKTAIIKLKSLISGKADKATTLSGYGITDGVKKWTGTKAEYDALTSYDDDTVYITTDENAATYVDSASFQAHLNNKNNPHGVTAAQLGVYTKTEVDTAINNHKVTTDSELSTTSENPVQNKVITSAIDSTNTKLSAMATIYHGTTSPDNTIGKDGDIYYFYKADGENLTMGSVLVYIKLSSKWQATAKIDVGNLTLKVVDTVTSAGTTFTVEMPSDFTGTFQWQYSSDGSSYYDCGAEVGRKTNVLHDCTTPNTYYYRLVVNGSGNYTGTTYVYRPKP